MAMSFEAQLRGELFQRSFNQVVTYFYVVVSVVRLGFCIGPLCLRSTRESRTAYSADC